MCNRGRPQIACYDAQNPEVNACDRHHEERFPWICKPMRQRKGDTGAQNSCAHAGEAMEGGEEQPTKIELFDRNHQQDPPGGPEGWGSDGIAIPDGCWEQERQRRPAAQQEGAKGRRGQAGFLTGQLEAVDTQCGPSEKQYVRVEGEDTPRRRIGSHENVSHNRDPDTDGAGAE